MNDIDWYCDECGAYMNRQRGFTTRSGMWKCVICGYNNDVTEDNIVWE
ncbi:MAG: Sec23/Sec24 zinc finger-containing protein [Clostridia bacterium]|nr:Sec23/Sec24 zinc finger-containing protein [Clostridia bacterium]